MEKLTEHTQVQEQEDNPHLFNKILKIAAYPVAVFSGLWVAKREVHEVVYDNLKRFGAFDDIMADLKPKNDINVAARVQNTIDVEEFLEKSAATKSAYSKAVGERMAHMGLGNNLKDFPAKWGYIRDSGKRSAVIQGMTVAGIAIGALLTIANSKSLIDYFAGDKENKDQSRW